MPNDGTTWDFSGTAPSRRAGQCWIKKQFNSWITARSETVRRLDRELPIYQDLTLRRRGRSHRVWPAATSTPWAFTSNRQKPQHPAQRKRAKVTIVAGDQLSRLTVSVNV